MRTNRTILQEIKTTSKLLDEATLLGRQKEAIQYSDKYEQLMVELRGRMKG